MLGIKIEDTEKAFFSYRQDVTSILLCVTELLFAASRNSAEYLDPSMITHPQFSIHNSCSCLLTALAVVSAPLEHVYR